MGLGLVVVEVCIRNAMAKHALEELEEEYPEVAIQRTDCLSMCNLCRARPYAMVNQKKIYDESEERCLGKVKEAVEEEIKAFFE
ncbi:YuzB family protein [Paenibacillus spongiae]|uniref:YuzB family protein n=1 Tax=Paenibacillus spongiae TaxID=2909671 RepID=A0ABY5SC74_9BACL|nr:YuzB family protein [Paenibacillus spongiae]UVI31556.1 YuzB family protein [Paenibacillus spongiae]